MEGECDDGVGAFDVEATEEEDVEKGVVDVLCLKVDLGTRLLEDGDGNCDNSDFLIAGVLDFTAEGLFREAEVVVAPLEVLTPDVEDEDDAACCACAVCSFSSRFNRIYRPTIKDKRSCIDHSIHVVMDGYLTLSASDCGSIATRNSASVLDDTYCKQRKARFVEG